MGDLFSVPFLTILIFLPTVATLHLMLVGKEHEETIKRIALTASLLTFALSLLLWVGFDPNRSGEYQYVESHAWIPQLGIGYHLGLDGVSLLLVVLTTFLTSIAILSAWTAVERRVKEFMIFL